MLTRIFICPRCDGTHAVECLPITKPIVLGGHTFNLWAMCPSLGQPIILRESGCETGQEVIDKIDAEKAAGSTFTPTMPEETFLDVAAQLEAKANGDRREDRPDPRSDVAAE